MSSSFCSTLSSSWLFFLTGGNVLITCCLVLGRGQYPYGPVSDVFYLSGIPDQLCYREILPNGETRHSCNEDELIGCQLQSSSFTFFNLLGGYNTLYCLSSGIRTEVFLHLKLNPLMKTDRLPVVMLLGLIFNGWVDFTIERKDSQHFDQQRYFDLKYFSESLFASLIQSKAYISKKISGEGGETLLLSLDTDTSHEPYKVHIKTSIRSSFWKLFYREEILARLAFKDMYKVRIYYKLTARTIMTDEVPDFVLSAPGYQTSFEIQCTQNCVKPYKLNVYWLKDIYSKYGDNGTKAQTCSSDILQDVDLSTNFSYCLQYIPSDTNSELSKRSYLFFRKSFPDDYLVNRFLIFGLAGASSVIERSKNYSSELKSWNEAFDMCQEAGGVLPVFHTKEEQHEVLNFVKLHLLPPEGVYIGLHFDDEVTQSYLH